LKTLSALFISAFFSVFRRRNFLLPVCLVLSSFFLSTSSSSAQTPPWLWAKQAHTPGHELAWDVYCDPASGNVYVGGSFDTNLSGVYGLGLLLSNGGLDGLLAKYDASGNVLWANKIGGAGADEIKTVCVDPAGNVYVAGYFNGTVDFDPSLIGVANLTAVGGQDGFLAKYTSAGAYVWAVKFGGAGTDEAANIYADASGVYMTGLYAFPASFYSTNATTSAAKAAQAGSNMFGVKYNSSGVVQWNVSGGSANTDQGYDVIADANNVYFTGVSADSMKIYDKTAALVHTVPNANPGNDAVFVLAVNQAGSYVWCTDASGDDVAEVRGITEDANNIYITGSFGSNVSFPSAAPVFTLSSSGGLDFYLAKIAKSTGTYQWLKTEPGANGADEQGQAVYADPNGSIYVTGNFNKNLDFSGDGGPVISATSLKADIFVASYMSSGTFQWVNQAGEKGDDIPHGISSDNAGSIYSAGEYAGNAIFGSTTLVKDSPTNLYLAKLGCSPLANNTIAAAQTICSGSIPATLTGSLPTGGSGAFQYTWQQSPDNSTWSAASGTNTGQNYSPPALSANTYYQRLVSSTSCTAGISSTSASILITVNPKPSKAFAGNDTSLCAANSTVFAAATPTVGTGAWTLYTGAGVPGGNLPRSPVTALGNGKNQFIWTVSNGVCPASKDTVAISVYQNPSKAYAGKDTTICGTTSVFAAANPTVGTGAWTLYTGTGLPAGNLPRSAVSGLGAGTDQFIWTVSNGICPASKDTMKFTVYKTPSKAFAGNDTTICGTASHFAAATPVVGTGAWSLYTGTGIPGSNLPRATVTALGYGQDKFIWTVSNGICPVSKDTMMFTAQQTPSIAFAGKDTTICGTTSVFAAATPTVGTGAWTLYTGAGIPGGNLPRSTVSALGAGPDKFIWTVSNGVCPVSRDTMMFTVYKTPSKAFAGNDTTICGTASHFAAATPAIGTGVWTLYTGAGIPAGNLPRSNVSGLGYGQDKFIWTVSNGICPVSRDTMMFTAQQLPSVAYAGKDTTICGTSSVFAAATPTVGTGIWSLYTGAGIPGGNLPRSTVSALGAGPDKFIWTVSNGVCPVSRDTMMFTVYKAPSKAFAGNDTTICTSSSHFAAAAPLIGTGAWTLYTGTGIPAGNLPRSNVNGLGVGSDKFIWTVSNGVCPVSKDTMMFTVQQAPSPAFAGNDTSICGSATILNASAPLIGTGSWALYSGSGTFNSAQPHSAVTALNPGKDQFIWTVTNGVCPSSKDTVTISAYQLPSKAFAGNDTTICSSSSHFAAATPVIGTGAWTLYTGTGIPAGNLPRSNVNGLGVGSDKFIWTVSNGVCPVSKDTMMCTVQQAPSPAFAGNDTSICGSATILNASTPAIGIGSWALYSGAGTFNSSQPHSAVTALNPGKDQFIWTITNGVCPPSADTVTITTYQIPSKAFAGNDTSVCGPATHFAATAPLIGSGSWSVYSGTGNPAANLPRSVVTGLSIGQDQFIWTVSNGVCPASKDTVMITSQMAPSPAFAGNDTSVCATSALFSAITPSTGSGSWALYTGSGTFNSTQPKSVVTGLGAGKNQFIWTISNGVCPSSTDTLTIIRYQKPGPANAGNDTSVCGFVTHLSAVPPSVGNGSWTVYSGSGTVAGNTPVANVSGLSPGPNKFIWTVRNGVCPASRDTVQITATPQSPPAVAGADQFICGNTTTLNGNTPPYGTGIWSLDSGSGVLSNPFNPTSNVSSLHDGKNTFTWSIQNGVCPATSSSVNIFAFSMSVTANAGPDEYVSAPSAILGAVTPASGVGTWTVVSGNAVFSDIHDPHSSITGLQPGQTVLLWTVANGPCAVSSDEMILTFGDFIIPNAFSPNGDGVNDVFEISGLESFGSIQFIVFNRWGNEVYASDDYKNNWNGLNKNGDELAEDTYYYILKPSGHSALKGFVILKRK
jgi:gliding motility-associated-like protein